MAFTNFDTKEINCKVIYFGPGGAGKTSNLRSIYENTSAEVKAGMLELENESGSTRYFDFLPISIGHVKDFHLKLHLFTLPAVSLFDSVNSVILKGVDGVVFVADSRIEAMVDNIECLKDMKKVLADQNLNYNEMPKVFQFNKRDLPDAVPMETMRQELNPGGVPDIEAVAKDSVGTLETLQTMAKLVIRKIAP